MSLELTNPLRIFAAVFFSLSCIVRAEPVVMPPLSILLQTQPDERLRDFIDASLNDVALVLQDHAVLTTTKPAGSFTDSAVFSNARFIIASAPVYALLERYGGFTAVASIKPDEAINADSASSTVVLVRRHPGNALVTLKALKGKTLAVLASEAFETRMQLADELLSQRQDAKSFFKITEHRGNWQSLIDALRRGDCDAVALSSRLVRNLGPQLPKDLHVVEPRLNLELNLPHTTSAYPGWVFAASFQTSRDFSDNLGALLRSLPDRQGYRWTKAADYRTIHQVLQRTDAAFYKSLQHRSIGQILLDYAAWILLVLVVLAGLVLHGVLAERLVKRRTRELAEMHQKQQEAQTRYEHLEKASIVGQMSNLVAHELRQPLAAITNYTMGARRRLKNGALDADSLSFALERTLQESVRANAIVEHVQGYAKQKRRTSRRFDLTAFLTGIASQYNDSQGNPRIKLNLQPHLELNADPLEIELCVKNLIKNAFEAGLAARKPMISLTAGCGDDGAVRICVSDEGFALSDTAFESLSVPFNSAKPDGLGLGLAIVRKITESYAGHLEFERRKPQGLAVTIVLPCEPSKKEPNRG